MKNEESATALAHATALGTPPRLRSRVVENGKLVPPPRFRKWEIGALPQQILLNSVHCTQCPTNQEPKTNHSLCSEDNSLPFTIKQTKRYFCQRPTQRQRERKHLFINIRASARENFLIYMFARQARRTYLIYTLAR